MYHGSARNRQLPPVQVGQVFRFQPPLNFRITGQRARAGTRHIGQGAVEFAGHRQLLGVGRHHLYVPRPHQSPQQAGALRMQVGGDDLRIRIALRQDRSFSSGRRAAVQQALAAAHQFGYKL